MRVLHIIHNLDRAGAQRSLASLLGGFGNARTDHLVAAWKRLGPVAEEIDADVIGGWGSAAKALRGLNTAVRTFRPDIVHAHMEDSALFAAMVASPRRLPFFITFHNGTRLVPDVPQPRKAARLASLRFAAHRAAGIIVVREALRPLLLDALGLKGEKIRTLPACVVLPPGEAVEASFQSRNMRGDRLDIVSVGRHVALKRHQELIAAARILAARGIGADVTILGDGPLLEENRRLAAEVPPPVRVTAPGAVADIGQRLSKATVLVNSSEYEGTSMAILEAMSWRVPVVASHVEGNREIVRAGETGFPYEAGNADDLADKIIAAAHGDTSGITSHARQMVQENFSAEALAGMHTDLYANALQERP